MERTIQLADQPIIGKGAQADVYRIGGKAVKVFAPGVPPEAAAGEAALQRMAHLRGLPVPAVAETVEIDGRAAIVMELAEGETLGALRLNHPAEAGRYMEAAVALQIQIHGTSGEGFPPMKDKLEYGLLHAMHLDDRLRDRLMKQLETTRFGSALCHCDFHGHNLVQTGGRTMILDWVSACAGSTAADACRSYLLYLLYAAADAGLYLDCYCRMSGSFREEILEWMPLIAAARLAEGLEPHHPQLLLQLVNSPL